MMIGADASPKLLRRSEREAGGVKSSEAAAPAGGEPALLEGFGPGNGILVGIVRYLFVFT